jgi:GNAT superfamily N-acetyltransferase
VSLQASLPTQPLLANRHFRRLDRCRLVRGALHYDAHIHRHDRQHYCVDFDNEADDRFERPLTRVICNPADLSLTRFNTSLRRAQLRHFVDEKINASYGFRLGSGRWVGGIVDDHYAEGQEAMLVAYLGQRPVGYFGLEVHLARDEARWYHLVVDCKMVYVSPAHRGRGIGVDLAAAGGELVSAVYMAAYRAAPAGAEFSCTVWADYESQGGVSIARSVFENPAYRAEVLIDKPLRLNVKVEPPELDAGW